MGDEPGPDLNGTGSLHRRRGYVLVAALALAVYLPGAWWGVPHATASNRAHAWGVDDETPLGALAEMHNILEPKENQNLGYPLMYSFLTAAASAPYLGYLRLRGEFESSGATYPFGFSEPVGAIATLGLIAHLVTVLLATGLVVAAFDAGRTTLGPRGGFVFALCAMLAYPMAYYARTGNVDVPMLFFIAVAFAAFTRCVVLGMTVRRTIALGAAVGFALATKEASLGAFLGMPLVLLPLQARAQADIGGLRSWTAWKPLVLALGVSVLALGVGSGLFVDPDRYIAHLRFLTGRLDTLAAGATPVHEAFPYTIAGSIAFSRVLIEDLASVMTWPGLLLALAGAAIAGVRRDRRALLVVPALTYILWMFATLRVAQLRYMLPGAFLLAPFGAAVIVGLWSNRGLPARALAVLAGGLVLGMLCLRTVDLSYQMIADSRYAAAHWLAERTSPGDEIEYFGADQKLPPLAAGVATRTAAPYRGMYVPGDLSEQAIAEILEGWAERRPKYVLAIPDHTSRPGSEISASFPPDLFEQMLDGRAMYVLVAEFQTEPLFPWLGLPAMDYPSVNPPVRIFGRDTRRQGGEPVP